MEEMLNKEQVGGEVQPTATKQPEHEEPYIKFTKQEYDNLCASLKKQGAEKALRNVQVKDGENVLTKADYDKLYRKDIEANAIAEYERKQKLSAEERFNEEKRQYELSFKEREIALNKREASTFLKEAGFDDEQMEVYLELVTEDREASLGKIKRICDTQKSTQEKLHKKWQEELQASNPSINIGSQDVNALQSQYNEAKASGNMALVAKIIRTAQASNVTLKD